MHGRILVVDDEEDTASLLADCLRQRGYRADWVMSAQECLERVEQGVVDIVVTDVWMPGMSGIELCQTLRERHPELLSIVVTGRSGLDAAISAIRAGAYDYIAKPVKVGALELAIARALSHLELQREVRRLRTVVDDTAGAGVIGHSPAILATLDMVERVAASDATVLVTGESGTGKELVARAVHHRSPRRDQPFVAINCAAMPGPLLESELFGHVRGAFTDAHRSRPGLFLEAGAGTVFLDEIGDMPIEMQVKLLRVLQERRVRAVGSDEEVPFAARVITSTNRDLETDVADKRFREDLYYRINVVAIHVPPLRDRNGDVLLLAQHFLRRIARRSGKPVEGLTPAAAQRLAEYDWPGNVRELENCMERAVALCRLDQITVDDLPAALSAPRDGDILIPGATASDLLTLSEMVQRYVRIVLTHVGGNKAHAARVLGIDRRSIYRRIRTGEHEVVASQNS